jgi:hypothetical protein
VPYSPPEIKTAANLIFKKLPLQQLLSGSSNRYNRSAAPKSTAAARLP